jgi:hypothetical protein
LAVGPLPPPHDADAPPGEFYYALATSEGTIVLQDSTAGHPAILRDRIGKQALNLVRRTLIAKKPGPSR